MSTTLALDDQAAASRRVVGTLRRHRLAVVPTDTVYGVIADAFSPRATAALRDATGLGPGVSLTVLIRSPRQVSGLVSDVPEAGDRLMASYWPGPLTLVLPAADGLTWDVGPKAAVALRMPADDLLLAVIGEVGPIVCSSAMTGDGAPPTTVGWAHDQLADAVALYVDGGTCDRAWSTIADLTGTHTLVLREGAVPASHVEEVAAGRVAWGAVPETPLPAEPPAAQSDAGEPVDD